MNYAGVRSTVVVAFVVIAGCAMQYAIRLAPQATTDSLVFIIQQAQGGDGPLSLVYGLSVIPCGTERPVWTISADGSRLMPDRVTYGRPLAGFITNVGPDSLRPGCYTAVVSSSNPLSFDVSPGGTITARPSKP